MNRSLSFIPVLSLIFLTLFSVSTSATQQAQERLKGDDEAMMMDEDFGLARE